MEKGGREKREIESREIAKRVIADLLLHRWGWWYVCDPRLLSSC